jgi:hypothetical protein
MFGGIHLKQIGMIFILVATLLNALSHLIHFIHTGFFDLALLYPTNELFLRFGDFFLSIGFLALCIGIKKDRITRWIVFLIMILGLMKFFFVEFGFLAQDTLSLNLLVTCHAISFILLIWRIKTKSCPLLTIKGYIIIIPIIMFILALHITSFIPYHEFNAMPRATESILPIFYTLYQLGLCIYFYEWYKEGFLYKNDVLYTI